jgi:phage gp46-like protein
MTDIALKWIDAEPDAVVNGADLLRDDGLESAVIISLACDARADENDQLPIGEPSRRGWWGDQFSDAANDRTGSKLWLLWREPRNAQTLERAKGYCEVALRWMIDDGVASSIECVTSFHSVAELTSTDVRSDLFALLMEIAIKKPDGGRETFRFARQWADQIAGGE